MTGRTAPRARHAPQARRDAAAKERERIRQIVHDVNTPLSALSLQLYLRRRSLGKPTAEELHFLDILDRNVERLRALVGSLLPAARGPTLTQPTQAAPTPQATPPGRPRRDARSTW